MNVRYVYRRSFAVDFATDAGEGVLAILPRFECQSHSNDLEGVCEKDRDAACYGSRRESPYMRLLLPRGNDDSADLLIRQELDSCIWEYSKQRR